MVTPPLRHAGWTSRHLRHVAGIFRQDQNPAARVYESIGSDWFLAPAPGWLNLGLWEGSGSEGEADTACRRLVQTVAAALPEAGVVLDVGNGLGTQDPVIVKVLRPRKLIAVNITEWPMSRPGAIGSRTVSLGICTVRAVVRPDLRDRVTVRDRSSPGLMARRSGVRPGLMAVP